MFSLDTKPQITLANANQINISHSVMPVAKCTPNPVGDYILE